MSTQDEGYIGLQGLGVLIDLIYYIYVIIIFDKNLIFSKCCFFMKLTHIQVFIYCLEAERQLFLLILHVEIFINSISGSGWQILFSAVKKS